MTEWASRMIRTRRSGESRWDVWRMDGADDWDPINHDYESYRLETRGNGKYIVPPMPKPTDLLGWKVTLSSSWEYGTEPPRGVSIWELWRMVGRSGEEAPE